MLVKNKLYEEVRRAFPKQVITEEEVKNEGVGYVLNMFYKDGNRISTFKIDKSARRPMRTELWVDELMYQDGRRILVRLDKEVVYKEGVDGKGNKVYKRDSLNKLTDQIYTYVMSHVEEIIAWVKQYNMKEYKEKQLQEVIKQIVKGRNLQIGDILDDVEIERGVTIRDKNFTVKGTLNDEFSTYPEHIVKELLERRYSMRGGYDTSNALISGRNVQIRVQSMSM